MFHDLTALRRGRRCWDFIKIVATTAQLGHSVVVAAMQLSEAGAEAIFFGGAAFLETTEKTKRRFDRFDVGDWCTRWRVPHRLKHH